MVDWSTLVLAPCMGIFGEQILYQPTGAAPFAFSGVFDEAYRPVDPLGLDGVDPSHITTEQSCLGVRLADLPTPPAQGDLLVARGAQYYVREVQSDGRGGAKLMLNKQRGQR